MNVDAHHHLWDTRRRHYPWLNETALQPIRRPFTTDEFRTACGGRADTTVLVQTIPDESETMEFLEIAAASAGLIAGVVGWVNLAATDVAERIAALRAGPGGAALVAIRHQVQEEPDPDWLARPAIRHGLRCVGAAGLAFDLLVRPTQLTAAIDVATSSPEMRFVLDHLGKPDIARQRWEPWASHIEALAAVPNVTAKLSGLVTQADWRAWDTTALQPYAHHAIDTFGPSRLMFDQIGRSVPLPPTTARCTRRRAS
jgi:L-fuconolactonase